MGYYSLRDPLHSNDVINNGRYIMAPTALKEKKKENILGSDFFFFFFF